jgi:hypothetical protein
VNTNTRTEPNTLVAEIEFWLRHRTAHPLVSTPTAELVSQALQNVPAPALSAPSRAWKWLPDRTLRRLGKTRSQRHVSDRELIGLAAMVLEKYGWTGAGKTRTRSGCRCIAGAFRLLVDLGYGDMDTVRAAGERLDAALRASGQRGPYYEWNDRPGRSPAQVKELLGAAQRR